MLQCQSCNNHPCNRISKLGYQNPVYIADDNIQFSFKSYASSPYNDTHVYEIIVKDIKYLLECCNVTPVTFLVFPVM